MLLPPMYDKGSKGIQTLLTWRDAELDIACKMCDTPATGYFRVNGQSAPCCGGQACKDKLIEFHTKKK